MLSEQGKPCSQVIIVEQGCCRAEVRLPNGKTVMVADDLEAGEVLGELGFLTKGIAKASIIIHDTSKCSVISNTMIMESLQPGKKSQNALRADIVFRFLAIKLVQRFQDMIAGREQPRKVSPNVDEVAALVFPDAAVERNHFAVTVFCLPQNESCISIAEGCCKLQHSRPVFGSLYLMDSFFGFHGNVFGFETTYVWALKSILEVQELRGSSDLGFSLVLARSEMGQEDDESPFIFAGIIVSQPEPKFRFDFVRNEVKDDFISKFRELLAADKFKNFSVRGGSHIINDISTIRLRKQKELDDFHRRQAAMSRYANSLKKEKKEGFSFSLFKKNEESKPPETASAATAQAEDAETNDDDDDLDIDAIVDGVEMLSYNRGEAILLQGSCEHNLFQIARGSAQVEVNGKAVAIIGVGAIFGEISFILKCASNATISAAVDNSLVYSIDGKFCQSMMQRSRRISASVYRFLADLIAQKIKARKLAAASAVASNGAAKKGK
jgi:CRP-like cAMP-binding protein